MPENPPPGLFGIKYSNRNFTKEDSWGKNQFNATFPASLSAFLEAQGFENVYLKLNASQKVYQSSISTTDLYQARPESEKIFYSFESPYIPFQQLVTGDCPRIDLVTMSREDDSCLRGIEIKLTALPDNSTYKLTDDKYSCELVVRPDTIVYLACSIAMCFRGKPEDLSTLIGNGSDLIEEWEEGEEIFSSLQKISDAINRIILSILEAEAPLIMQPIWKTIGKSPKLADNCLDVFVWSNLAFTQLFLDIVKKQLVKPRSISRQMRTVVWLFKMLYDFSQDGQIDHRIIIDGMSLNTKNDKAFSVNGRGTYPYMKGDILTKPRITKNQIKEIIIGGGQKLLSPERRFDAIIFNSPNLFK